MRNAREALVRWQEAATGWPDMELGYPDTGTNNGFPSIYGLVPAFFTLLIFPLAVNLCRNDPWLAASFIAVLFYCLRLFEGRPTEFVQRWREPKIALWLLSTIMIAMLSYSFPAIMPPYVAVLAWFLSVTVPRRARCLFHAPFTYGSDDSYGRPSEVRRSTRFSVRLGVQAWLSITQNTIHLEHPLRHGYLDIVEVFTEEIV